MMVRFSELKPGKKFKRTNDRATYMKIQPCFRRFGCNEIMEITAVRLVDGSVWNIQDDTEVIFEEVL